MTQHYQMNSLCWQILIFCLLNAPLTQCRRAEYDIVRDVDGNIYHTTLIGKYRWMTENLKTTRYNDGSHLSCIKDHESWFISDSAAYCYYHNNESFADTFGILYNWYAVNTGKLCPEGWRVPSDEEWMNIEGSVDSRYKAGDSAWLKPGLRGYDAGQKLRSADRWRPGIAGTDDFGFSALPGGERFSSFHGKGSSGFWWSSTEAGQYSSYYRSLIYSFGLVSRDTHPKRMGFSVRCIKDPENIK